MHKINSLLDYTPRRILTHVVVVIYGPESAERTRLGFRPEIPDTKNQIRQKIRVGRRVLIFKIESFDMLIREIAPSSPTRTLIEHPPCENDNRKLPLKTFALMPYVNYL